HWERGPWEGPRSGRGGLAGWSAAVWPSGWPARCWHARHRTFGHRRIPLGIRTGEQLTHRNAQGLRDALEVVEVDRLRPGQAVGNPRRGDAKPPCEFAP